MDEIAQLGAQAGALDEQADDLRRAAARLLACADELPDELRGPDRLLASGVWEGPAARDAREALDQQGRRVTDLAARLDERAARLRRRAGDLAADADALRRAQARRLAER